MDYFPLRDLTSKYISSSYQDVLQKYLPTGSLLYVLDGLGYSIFTIPSASIGQTVITSDVTASMTVGTASVSIVVTHYQDSSSYSEFASHSLSAESSDFALVAGNTLYTASYSITASYAENAGGGGTVLQTGSFYPISVSYATNAGSGGTLLETGSFYPISVSYANNANNALSSDFALVAGNTLYTASYSITASYAENAGGGGTSLQTGSFYPISVSYATNAGSGGGGTSLETGSFYPISVSYSTNTNNALSSDFALVAGNTLYTASYSITASYAENGGNGSGGTSLISGSLYIITSSWSVNSQTSSYTLMGGLNIPNYDFSALEYNGPNGQFSKVTYRLGGISGSIVCIVDAYYSGSLFMGVSKSLG